MKPAIVAFCSSNSETLADFILKGAEEAGAAVEKNRAVLDTAIRLGHKLVG